MPEIRNLTRLIYCLTFFLAVCPCAQEMAFAAPASSGINSYVVRVAVINDASEVELRVKGRYSIHALPMLEMLREDSNLNKCRIVPTNSGLLMGVEAFNIYGIRIKPIGAATIYVNGRKFRGDIDVVRTEKMKLLVINHVDIEDYVSGVLYHEVSHLWPMEVLKAQAIASRTFAVYKTIESLGRDYDLTNDIYSQVYGGRTSEKYRTSRAVRETKGKILIYKDKVLPAYFHATCGGHTEDASLLWNVNMPPLKGKPCSYCQKSPHFKWTATISLADIEGGLNKAGYKVGGIKDIKILSRDNSGRVAQVGIPNTLGEEKIPANRFRLAVGPNILRSANFDVVLRGKSALFTGIGWGHGVGMCQWGAYYMSKDGFSAAEILKFYYPGASIANMKYLLEETNE
ncbi:MAG: SpoIID/LytB domain-containing protein [Candidatus Omnitrophica bacterium]|nr:SpoIID/LytB domain-containing protein [Candidatus Omnitrophota bacterium]MBU4487755.1 SpoIID/LytB domain-containing protein [Candidatus Omnitrophota bacterium]